MPSFLGNSLGGFFAGGVFHGHCFLPRLRFFRPYVSSKFAVFQYCVAGVFFAGPTLFVFHQSNDLMGFFFVETLVRLYHFTSHRVHSVDGNVDVIIFGVVMQTIDGLVPDKAHAFQKNIHQFIHLGTGWLLMLCQENTQWLTGILLWTLSWASAIISTF